MTSSAPEGSSEKKGSKLAGRRFGIDLRKLFEDEEGGSVFDGFEPMMGTTTKEYLKGRSPATVTYKAAPPNVREVTTGPVLAQAAIETPSAPAPIPEPTPEPEAPKTLAEMSGQEIFQNFSQYDQGEQGLFGGKDVDYLRGQGVADETIREVARLRSAGEQTPAAVYARLGGTLTSPTPSSSGPNPQQYAADYLSGKTDVGEQGIFGGQDVDAMRQQGYSDEQIRAAASAVRGAGQTLPAAVFRRLGSF